MPNTIHLEKSARLLKIVPLLCIVLLFACKSQVVAPKAEATPYEIEKLLILPFQDMSGLYGEDASVRCDLCGKVFTTGRVETGSDELLTEHLIALMKSQAGFELLSGSTVRSVGSDLLSGKRVEKSELDLILETGRDLGADGVMVGHLYRFVERIGNRLSVESPASVAFDIDIVRVADGAVIWGGSFDETQRTLSEDLFKLDQFLKRKGGWVTAEELGVHGLESLVVKLPKP
ncbi:hypothetical protein ACFL0O_00205 [Thermodesulfobacteriota bacterium]